VKDKLIVFQSDFGNLEGTVSQMYGVALQVDPSLRIFEITHNITPFNIWEASFRLFQTINSWAPGTVFVSVVDPGVGSDRKSVVALTETGHYIVTPDNGTLTHAAVKFGIKEVREIDESVNRAPGSGDSHTFHGRDVYGYTGARLASGAISFKEVGPEINVDQVVCFPVVDPVITKGEIDCIIDILDIRYGNVWTNCTLDLFNSAGFCWGDKVEVTITFSDKQVYLDTVDYAKSFSAVEEGKPLIYANELLFMALSLNQGNFAAKYGIDSGSDWKVSLKKI